MNTFRCFASALSALSVWFVSAQAQAPQSPRITHLMPIGGQAGSTFELRVAGASLGDVEGVHFNFPGVKVEPIGSETTVLPPKMVKGKAKKGMTKPPGALTTQRFKVTLPANAPPGIQDVRIVTKGGVSNPRAFVVSDQKEYSEQEPNDDVPKAQKIDVNSSVSGVISVPTDVDYYSFTAKKGQRIVCSCLTTSIDSKLPVFLQVYSSTETYLRSNRGYNGNDAILDFIAPEDDEYFVRVCCFSYTQGGIDHFYRLNVTSGPWIDAVFPSVIEAGKDTQVAVYGRNLPGGKLDPASSVNDRVLEKVVVTIKGIKDPKALQRLAFAGQISPSGSMLDGLGYQLKTPAGASNTVLLTYAIGSVVLDDGDNDTQAKAQKISVPCTIAGRIEKKGDRDWYAFTAKKGQIFHIDAFGDRLGSPVDLFFQIRSETGLIVEQDDNPEILSPQFYTRNDDPQGYRFVAPADGTFYLLVSSRDAFTQHGPRHTYTVTVRLEEPDFRLVAMPIAPQFPDAATVHKAGGVAFNLYVWRLGGFNDEIRLAGENLPPGLIVPPQTISGNLKQAVAVIFAEPSAKPWTGGITITGTATVKGKRVTREVRSATMIWAVPQPNTPALTRLDRELVVAIRDQAPYTLSVVAKNITVKQGDKISIPVKLVPGPGFKGNVSVVAIGGPSGLASIPISLTPGQPGGTATLDAKGKKGIALAPGNYTIFLRGQTAPINPKVKLKIAPLDVVQVSMPVSVTVIPKQLAKLAVAGATNIKVKVGKSVDITVRAARLYDLSASFKVELILPPNFKNVSAKQATIKTDQDETTLTVTASDQAKVGSNQSVIIRATAMFNYTIPIVHETKVTLVITK